MRATTLLKTSLQLEVCTGSYALSKWRESKLLEFWTPTWESWDKKPFGCGPHGKLQSILYGGRWWLPLSPGHGESCESRVARGLS
jgi:hypothetical protein